MYLRSKRSRIRTHKNTQVILYQDSTLTQYVSHSYVPIPTSVLSTPALAWLVYLCGTGRDALRELCTYSVRIRDR